MKNKISILIISLLITVPLTSCCKAAEHDIVVYKTSTGTKYHKENCRYVKGKAIDINLSIAIYDGLNHCKVCNPPIQKYLEVLNK